MDFRSAEFVLGAVQPRDLPSDGRPEVAFAGRSNVGKSSLINRLVQRKRLARTSSSPGKTQQLNYYCIDHRFYLVDLPGYGFVRGGIGLRARLGKLTATYLENRPQLRAVVQLVDARQGPTDLDRTMIDWLRDRQKPFLMVFTKVDKISRGGLHELLGRLEASGEFADLSFVPFSALTGEGGDDIAEWIVQAVGLGRR
jgi:GTP-binding protein